VASGNQASPTAPSQALPEAAVPPKTLEESPSSPHDLTLPVPEIEADESLRRPAVPFPPGEPPSGFVYDIPLVRNAFVEHWIEYFTGPGRDLFAQWLRRSGRYVGPWRQILKEHGLPEDLVYLALIESGFSLRARSRAGAVGPWQFMEATARRIGLRVDRYLDERRDPIKSTRAAASYLSRLYEEFGDWHLALAAYNAGERRVRSAIQASGKKGYWAIARTNHLPNETRNYVAKFLAGMIIAKHPEVFGFVGIEYEKPLRFEVVSLPKGMSLKAASGLSGTPLAELAELNPELRLSVTPPMSGHQLRVPPERAQAFRERLAQAPEKPYTTPASGQYQIQPGDSFGAIAERFGMPIQTLVELNAHLDPRRLQVGTSIRLPGPPSEQPQQAATEASEAEAPSHHIVGPGESVWTIARSYGVSPDDILRLNSLSSTAVIYPGDRLRIRR